MGWWDDLVGGFVNPFENNGVFWAAGGQAGQDKYKAGKKAAIGAAHAAGTPTTLGGWIGKWLAGAGIGTGFTSGKAGQAGKGGKGSGGGQTDADKHAAYLKWVAWQQKQLNKKLINEKKGTLATDYRQFITDLNKAELDAGRKWTQAIQGNVTNAYASGVAGASVGAWQTEYQKRAGETQTYLESKRRTATSKYQSAMRVTDIRSNLLDTNYGKTMEDINWWLYNKNQSGLDSITSLGAQAGMTILGAGLSSGNPWMAAIGGGIAGISVIGSYLGSQGGSYTPFGG